VCTLGSPSEAAKDWIVADQVEMRYQRCLEIGYGLMKAIGRARRVLACIYGDVETLGKERCLRARIILLGTCYLKSVCRGSSIGDEVFSICKFIGIPWHYLLRDT